MSQTTSSHGWFTQLQKQYPTGALVTELVQIHQERFIVRAIVQISGVAIATSMAESANLETAEDQARLRVLDWLGISVIAKPSHLAAPIAPDPLAASIERDRVPEAPFPNNSSISIRQPIDSGFPIQALSSLDLEAIGVTPPPLPAMPVDLVDLSVPFSTALFPEDAMPAEEESTDEAMNNPVEEYLASVEDYGTGYEDSEPEDLLSKNALPEDPFLEDVFLEDVFPKDRLIEAETIAAIAPTDPIQDDQREEERLVPSNSGKPKKAIAEEKRAPDSIPDSISDANEPDDLSTLIAHTDIEMDRIGWTKQQGRDYLKRTYKKSTRQRLDVDELMDFLNYLRAVPSANGI